MAGRYPRSRSGSADRVGVDPGCALRKLSLRFWVSGLGFRVEGLGLRNIPPQGLNNDHFQEVVRILMANLRDAYVPPFSAPRSAVTHVVG